MKFMKKMVAGMVIATIAASCAHRDVKVHPLMTHEQEISEIIAQMTLEEKVEMLYGKNMFSSAGVPRLGIADIEYADGPFGIREEMEPHSWRPLGLSTDSATFFPTGSALAATWSPELAYEYGQGMAIEARLRGKDMILGPAINIQRIPTGGRTYEYLSEDPLLSAQLAVGYTRGVQDHGAAVCLKHYALNNQENMRGFVSSNASERVMREMYLLPFEAAVVEADAYGVMAAYNKVNGTWCSENDLLQNKILRDEWGFRGAIISDWGGVHSTVGAAMGGLDVEMPRPVYMGQALLDSIRAGVVPESVIDSKVRNLLRVRMAIAPVPADSANRIMTSQPEQQQIAYRVASKSVVMLKNEGVLPLDIEHIRTIAVIGDNATRHMAQGGVGAGVKTLYEISPLDGLRKALEHTDIEVLYAQGYNGEMPKPQYDNRTHAVVATDSKLLSQQNTLRAEALEVARRADVVLYIGGDNRVVETEGSDRQTIALPFGQDQLLKELAAINPNIVSVIVAGAPVDLTTVVPASRALLYSWFNGSEGGHALADILVGNISPSGRLPFTLPIRLEDSPAYALGVYPQEEVANDDVFVNLVNQDQFRDKRRADANYDEGMLVGYRWFTTKNLPTLYPFGYGLTYGEFEYDGAAVYTQDNCFEVQFTLTNSGRHDAEEVCQVYVSRPDSRIERPALELKGFERVMVESETEKLVSIRIPRQALRHWDEAAHAWTVEPGRVVFYIGSSSENLPISVESKI